MTRMPLGKPTTPSPDADDLTCEVAAEDGRQLDGHEFCGGAIADLQIDRVDTGGADANQHFASADFADRPHSVWELVHAAETIDHDCFHDCVSLVREMIGRAKRLPGPAVFAANDSLATARLHASGACGVVAVLRDLPVVTR